MVGSSITTLLTAAPFYTSRRSAPQPVKSAILLCPKHTKDHRRDAGKHAPAMDSWIKVIYFIATVDVIYLVMAYPKNVKDSLNDTEKAELKKLTRILKDEVKNEFF